jgi:hypothetical protein
MTLLVAAAALTRKETLLLQQEVFVNNIGSHVVSINAQG